MKPAPYRAGELSPRVPPADMEYVADPCMLQDGPAVDCKQMLTGNSSGEIIAVANADCGLANSAFFMLIGDRRTAIAVELLFSCMHTFDRKQFKCNQHSPIRNEYRKCEP
jgi:hypothetical protein